MIDSSFWWIDAGGAEVEWCVHFGFRDEWKKNSKFICPAPLTDEILKVLPEKIYFEDVIFRLKIFKIKNDYLVRYRSKDGLVSIFSINKKPSNALLRLAIRLKDEGII